jgi:hypothetical protein
MTVSAAPTTAVVITRAITGAVAPGCKRRRDQALDHRSRPGLVGQPPAGRVVCDGWRHVTPRVGANASSGHPSIVQAHSP